MSKKPIIEPSTLTKVETESKKIIVKGVSTFSKWSIKKKIIGVLMAFMVICTLNCFLTGGTVMEVSKSSIHEIEALLYYVLAAINCCSAIILGYMFEKE